MLALVLLLMVLPQCPTEGSLSSAFGYRWHPIEHRRKFHRGIDIAAPEGQEVRAIWPGKVVGARYRAEGYGRFVLIESGRIRVLYAHLSRHDVKKGDVVEAGQIIGTVGQTGSATGPHLHLGFFRGKRPARPWLVAHCYEK